MAGHLKLVEDDEVEPTAKKSRKATANRKGKAKPVELRYFLLKVQLRDMNPPVARLIVMPSGSSLDFVHSIIQLVMGWNDIHMYGFRCGETWYVDHPGSPEDGLPALRHTLEEAVDRHGPSLLYVYDFGDDWLHDVTVLDMDYPRPADAVAVECLDGTGPCPIEDVGGVPEYQEFVQIMSNRRHPEYRAMKNWLDDHPNYGPGYDWRNFGAKNIKDINRLLKYLLTPDARIP